MKHEPNETDPLNDEWRQSFIVAMLVAKAEKFGDYRTGPIFHAAAETLTEIIFETATTYGEACEMFAPACAQLVNSTVCEHPNDLIALLGYPGWHFAEVSPYFEFFMGLAHVAAVTATEEQMLVFNGHPAIPQAREALLLAQAIGELVEIDQ